MHLSSRIRDLLDKIGISAAAYSNSIVITTSPIVYINLKPDRESGEFLHRLNRQVIYFKDPFRYTEISSVLCGSLKGPQPHSFPLPHLLHPRQD